MAVEIQPGRYYSNGAYGRVWGVRMVVAIETDGADAAAVVRFKGVAGGARRQSGTLSLAEFRRWVRHEVRLVENDWKRIDD